MEEEGILWYTLFSFYQVVIVAFAVLICLVFYIIRAYPPNPKREEAPPQSVAKTVFNLKENYEQRSRDDGRETREAYGKTELNLDSNVPRWRRPNPTPKPPPPPPLVQPTREELEVIWRAKTVPKPPTSTEPPPRPRVVPPDPNKSKARNFLGSMLEKKIQSESSDFNQALINIQGAQERLSED